ncbi:MAG: PQQ-dependent dehydrogenase, methanol/ethanol family [Pseudomonadota bacterium]
MPRTKYALTSHLFPALLVLFACAGCEETPQAPATDDATAATPAVTPVTSKRLAAAKGDDDNWLLHGRTYDEQRFSPLTDINTDTVAELGLAWYFDVPTRRGMEATPIIVDGRLYATGSWSIVYALDAATGELLWRHDPKVDRAWAQYACCDVVNRGVAVWNDTVFVATIDGYLVAVNAASGAERWRVDTIDRTPPYTITGAPRVVNGLVMIGNGGAEFGVRGYVSAYAADTGELAWRFYTVPGDPDAGFENAAMERAAATWTGEWWRYGGGGTVWDSMAYDPALDLLYVGVGNGSPWNRKVRSPDGGDNLFLSSIVALRPATGEYVWHYQTTPGDTWDYTATQHMILADLQIGGENRQVLMQAPKNGFFYVLDRATGEPISAQPYVTVTWAERVDLATGRPVETANARYSEGPSVVMPSPYGGHNWHPMAFSPATGLVYVPAQELPFVYGDDSAFEFTPGSWNTGTDFEFVASSDDKAVAAEIRSMIRGQLVAWDPVAQKEVWRYQHAGPWNGGTLATAGGLVFQGSLLGEMAAYDASTGERLWQFDAQTGVAAAPVTYRAGGAQHVAVAVGWGTVFSMNGGPATGSLGLRNHSRILSFALAGDAALPARPAVDTSFTSAPPAADADPAQVAAGKDLYFRRCFMCHGDGAVSGGVMPDLRHASETTHTQWDAIVLGGARRSNGMPAFGGMLDAEGSEAIRQYVLERAWRSYREQQAQQEAGGAGTASR